MIPPFLAPSLVRLRQRVDELWPERDRRSDGWIGDRAHSTRVSDHNPDDRGMVHAVDFTRAGLSISTFLQGVIGHEAVEYVIFSGQIWSRVRDFRPVHYDGPNPHTMHVHVSCRHTHVAEYWGGTWLPEPEDTMPLNAEDLRRIGELVDQRLKAQVTAIVTGLLDATIETYFDKNEDGKRDPERVWQALAGAHSESYEVRRKVDRISELLTELQNEVRAGE